MGLQPFQEYFIWFKHIYFQNVYMYNTYKNTTTGLERNISFIHCIKPVVHQRWAKTREPGGEKPPDHS